MPESFLILRVRVRSGLMTVPGAYIAINIPHHYAWSWRACRGRYYSGRPSHKGKWSRVLVSCLWSYMFWRVTKKCAKNNHFFDFFKLFTTGIHAGPTGFRAASWFFYPYIAFCIPNFVFQETQNRVLEVLRLGARPLHWGLPHTLFVLGREFEAFLVLRTFQL